VPQEGMHESLKNIPCKSVECDSPSQVSHPLFSTCLIKMADLGHIVTNKMKH